MFSRHDAIDLTVSGRVPDHLGPTSIDRAGWPPGAGQPREVPAEAPVSQGAFWRAMAWLLIKGGTCAAATVTASFRSRAAVLEQVEVV